MYDLWKLAADDPQLPLPTTALAQPETAPADDLTEVFQGENIDVSLDTLCSHTWHCTNLTMAYQPLYYLK